MRQRVQNPVLLVFAIALLGVVLAVAFYFNLGTREALLVPHLSGHSFGEARLKITQLGFKLGIVDSAYSREIPLGRVIATIPPGGSWAHRGSTLDILLSKGPEGVVVPDLSGRRPERALQILRKRGLTGELEGKGVVVVSQEPGPGALLAPGGIVRLRIGGGEE